MTLSLVCTKVLVEALSLCVKAGALARV